MAFTAQDVKTLREITGCGMMECKKALTEADGNQDKAIELLRERGLAAAAKKASRIAAEGIVKAYVDTAKKVGVVIEVNAETDFVAKNAEFQAFVETCAKTVVEANPADVEALNASKAVGSEMTIADLTTEKIQTIGENIKIRRFVRYEGDVATYIHAGGNIGVMVKFDTDVADKEGFEEYGKDVAMQIAAANPSYLNESEVPAEVLEKEKELDKLIDKYMIGWTTKRLGNIDQAIFRMSVYELLYCDTPNIVCINEGIELCKKYSDEKVTGLLNSVLDKIYDLEVKDE